MKQKRMLIRILISAAAFIVAWLLPLEGIAQLIVYLAVYALIGWDVLWRAVRNIAHGQVFDENFLMTVATIGAFCLQEYREAVAVMLFYQVGELFQSYAVGRSRRSIASLMDIRPDYANVEENGELVRRDPEEIAVGQSIVVLPGERVPLDGTVEAGHSSLDTSALTGEPVPRDVKKGEEVISGCVNLTGRLQIRVSRAYGESTVARILDLVENSTAQKARAENFITRFARVYTPAVVIAAVLLAVVPPLFLPGHPFGDWIFRALTFLVISCPCALVISVPLSFFGGIGGASRKGVLVKGSNYLEALSRAEIVVFDKTGTLTKGSFTVTQAEPAPGWSREELVELAAYAESQSLHPIAQSIQKAASASLQLSRVQEVEERAGYGVRARVDGRTVLAGNRRWMEQAGISCEEGPAGRHHSVCGGGRCLCRPPAHRGRAQGGCRSAVAGLKEARVRETVMLTGDSRAAAEKAAKQVGIDRLYAGLLPDDKVEKIEELFREKTPGGQVVFVGDGINDAPVLARADVGVAMGGLGSDAAIEAADVVIMTDEPGKLVTAIRIARKTMRIVRQNIVFALGVKAVVLVLGALGMTNLWAAVFADVGVSVIAICNAIRALRPPKE